MSCRGGTVGGGSDDGRHGDDLAAARRGGGVGVSFVGRAPEPPPHGQENYKFATTHFLRQNLTLNVTRKVYDVWDPKSELARIIKRSRRSLKSQTKQKQNGDVA